MSRHQILKHFLIRAPPPELVDTKQYVFKSESCDILSLKASATALYQKYAVISFLPSSPRDQKFAER